MLENSSRETTVVTSVEDIKFYMIYNIFLHDVAETVKLIDLRPESPPPDPNLAQSSSHFGRPDPNRESTITRDDEIRCQLSVAFL